MEAYVAFTSFPDDQLHGDDAEAKAEQRASKVALAQAAAAVSEAQGLPAGQYDFFLMSEAQLNAVMRDLVINRSIAGYGPHGGGTR